MWLLRMDVWFRGLLSAAMCSFKNMLSWKIVRWFSSHLLYSCPVSLFCSWTVLILFMILINLRLERVMLLLREVNTRLNLSQRSRLFKFEVLILWFLLHFALIFIISHASMLYCNLFFKSLKIFSHLFTHYTHYLK